MEISSEEENVEGGASVSLFTFFLFYPTFSVVIFLDNFILPKVKTLFASTMNYFG